MLIPIGYILFYITLLLLCAIISIFIHEIFHFIFFKYAGLVITELRIFIFSWRFENNTVKFRFFNGLSGGSCSCVINSQSPKNRLYLAIIMGGLGNLIFALMLSCFYFIIDDTTSSVWRFIEVQILVCIIDVFYNLLNPKSDDWKLLKYVHEMKKVRR